MAHKVKIPKLPTSIFTDESKAIIWVWMAIASFSVISILTLKQVLKIWYSRARTGEAPPVSLTGGRSRSFFIILLLLSNLSRTFSLLVTLLLEDAPNNSEELWWSYVFRSFPSLMFLSTYSVVILFWSQVYYASTLVSYPWLRPIFTLLNALAYLVYFGMAVTTYYLNAYETFRNCAIMLVGILYSMVSMAFAYYGMKVANQLVDRSKEVHRKHSIIRRVMVLCTICPIVFLARGVYGIACGSQLLAQYYPPGIARFFWDFVVYMLSEFVPSALILVVFWNKRATRQPLRTEFPTQEDGYGDLRQVTYQALPSQPAPNWQQGAYREVRTQPPGGKWTYSN
eukprot:Platyproteum_vivax@DN5000_c0_g1_i2.p1